MWVIMDLADGTFFFIIYAIHSENKASRKKLEIYTVISVVSLVPHKFGL